MLFRLRHLLVKCVSNTANLNVFKWVKGIAAENPEKLRYKNHRHSGASGIRFLDKKRVLQLLGIQIFAKDPCTLQ